MRVGIACGWLLFLAVLTTRSASATVPVAPSKVRWVPGEILVQVDPALVLPESTIDSKRPDFSRAAFRGQQAPGFAALNLRYRVAESEWVLPRYRPAQLEALRHAAARNATSPRRLALMGELGRWVRIKANRNADVPAMLKDYGALAEVLKAEPNYIFDLTEVTPNRPPATVAHPTAKPGARMLAAVTPNDPSSGSQWGLSYIHAPDAWSITQGSPSTVIAVIDTGIDRNHPDMAGKIWTNPFEAPGDSNGDGCPGRCGTDDDGDGLIDEDKNGIQQGQPGWNAGYAADDDENGYIDDFPGWNFVGTGEGQDNNDPQDDQGHGTHVAGVAAAATNNGIGIAGVCPLCNIMPLKAFDASGTGTSTNIAKAVDYAWRNGASVINMSFGSYADSSIVRNELSLAYSTSVLVAAAGNDARARVTPPAGSNCPIVAPFYPAAYTFVLGVEALNQDGSHAGFSNCQYPLSAPGVGILSTLFDDTYASWSGTSMAAPFVAGVAGLVRSQHAGDPAWGPDLVFGQMVQSGGDALQAVTISPAPRLNFVSDAVVDTLGSCASCDGDGSPDAGESVNVVVTIRNLWGNATGVSGTLTTADPLATVITGTSTWGGVGPAAFDDNSDNPFRVQINPTAGNNYNIVLNLAVVAGNGGTGFNVPLVLRVQRGVTKGGIISASETWTADNIYLVTQNLRINSGVTVTIAPGTRIQVASGKSIVVQGTVVARGTPTSRILFTGNPDDWSGIVFDTPSTPAALDANGNWISGNVLEYCVIEKLAGGNVRTFGHQLIRSSIFSGTSSPLSFLVGIYGTGAIFEKNLITNNNSSGIDIQASSGSAIVKYNTIVGNYGRAESTRFVGVTGSEQLVYNNIFANGMPSLGVSGVDVDVSNNYWGTTSSSVIASEIYDFFDSAGFGVATFDPPLSAPDPLAPPVVTNVVLSPVSPLGAERATFTINFSKPMNTAITPLVFFGPVDPYTSHPANLNPIWSPDGTTFTVQADITA
jgi:subtilisin family serine protease